MTVSELFERGLRRNRDVPLSVQGAVCRDAEGNCAGFSLDLEGGKIAGIGFRVSVCATLIAYCELIAETLPGRTVDLAQALTPRDLLEQLARRAGSKTPPRGAGGDGLQSRTGRGVAFFLIHFRRTL